MKEMYVLVFGVIILMLSSCASPYELLNKGKYDRAVDGAIRKIKKRKNVGENSQVLIEAMDRIVKRENLSIIQSSRSTNPNDWERAMVEAGELKGNLYKVERYTDDRYHDLIYKMQDLETELNDRLYSYYKDRGDRRLEYSRTTGDKQSAQDAFDSYEAARTYAADEFEIERRLDESIHYGKTSYLIEAYSVFDRSLNWSIDKVFKDLEKLSTPFKHIYYKRGDPKGMDAVVLVEINPNISGVVRSVDHREFSKDIIVRYEKLRDTSGQLVDAPVYKTIIGFVDVVTLRKHYRVDAKSLVTNVRNGSRLANRLFRQDEEVALVYNELGGNHNAIPEEYKKNRQLPSFTDDDTFELLLKGIFIQLEENYLFE